MARTDVLGAILAGGRSSRFGSPKATAHFLGESLALRLARTTAQALTDVVVVTHLAEVRRTLPFPTIPDEVSGAGPLGGLHAALRRAGQAGLRGVVLIGCDMPLLPAALITLVAAHGLRSGERVAAPAVGPRGIHPLCAWYDLACLPGVEEALAGPDRSLLGIVNAMGVHLIPDVRLREVCDPGTAFVSVDTPGALQEAERLARSRAAADPYRPAGPDWRAAS